MNMESAQRAGAAFLWLLAIALGVVDSLWLPCSLIFSIHFVEVFVKGIPVGRKAGLGIGRSILLTLVFGFTWWLPLERRIKG